ncbi:hypothetical protein AC249_AIPGENE26911, partial [Exaiptasia diaphana]
NMQDYSVQYSKTQAFLKVVGNGCKQPDVQ